MLSAQDAPTDALRAEARAAFEAGRAALERGDAATAIEALERSLAQLPYLPTAYNLAIAHAEGGPSGDPSRAANLAHAILAGELGSLNRRQRREAAALLQSVRPRVGRVTVLVTGTSDPWLEVDDVAHAARPDDLVTLYVQPGRHVFAVGGEGARAHHVGLRVGAGQSEELRIDLSAPPRGTLRVRSAEDAEPVAIVGVREGASPLEATVPVGVYEVGLRDLPGSRRSVSVDADRVREILVERPPKRWPKVLGGVVAALLVAGAALAIGLSVRRDDGGPEDDPVFGTIEALRVSPR